MAELYQVASTEKIKNLEAELAGDLKELKQEIEENEMVHGIPHKTVSSVTVPKDTEHFRRERKLIIDRTMEVSEAKPLIMQADLMKEELQSAESHEYTPQNLPLLLQQYFLDRIHQLVQAKHMHMLRWKRFCEHTSTIEPLYPHYSERLAQIMSEYNDCLERSQRLVIARESHLLDNQTAVQSLKLDDLLIYLRWLVCHLHSLKRFNQYLRVLQWLPVTHKFEVAPDKAEVTEVDENTQLNRMTSRYQDDSLSPRPRSAGRPGSATGSAPNRTFLTAPPPPTAPPINPAILSTTPMPASSISFAAAAAGGGVASDETTLHLPLHMNDLESLRPHLNYLVSMYGVPMDMENVSTTADEMELFAAVNRKFRPHFLKQETMKVFKTYDRIELGLENWGADVSSHALKQISNWLPFIKLLPDVNPHQEKMMTELRQKNNIDEVLKIQSKFLQVTDPERIQDTLREHAVFVRDPRQVHAVSVSSNRTSYHSSAVWRKLYANPDLFSEDKKDDSSYQDFDEKDTDNVDFSNRPRSPKKRKDSYDYVSTVQMLGLDEGSQDSNDPVSMQGGFLTFLHLRHLRIRDLQRTCLSILNYFRSVERTITINDRGLSLEAGKLKKSSPQNHRKGIPVAGGMGGGGSLGSHAYLHNTPTDFKVSETEFMEFSEVENHDDFYTMDEGRIHVQDQRGYFVMYDAALDDLKKLENDLLLVATHFIEKDREMRSVSAVQRTESAAKRRQQQSAGDFDILSYAHSEVDRFAVLLDLWSNHAAFLECKKNLLDCYMEAYQHVFDRDEKKSMAQVITDIMHKVPRFDFNGGYFVKSYRQECINLRLQMSLVKSILDKQIEDQREYIQRVCREGGAEFGLPYKVIPKQLISINMGRSALRNIYMLEFHPTLAVASRIPPAIKHAFWELFHVHKPESVTEQLSMERKLLECALKEWDNLPTMGSAYSPQIQKDLFSDVFVEDPLFVCEIAQTLVAQEEENPANKSTKEKNVARINALARLMEAVTLRYRLLDAASECEILSKVYRKQSVELSFDEYHLFLQFVQFEFATVKPDAGKPPPVHITAIQEDDFGVAKYVPNHLYLGIHELDQGHVGRFSFRSRDGVLQIMKGQGLESMQAVYMTQVVHKNSLIASVLQADACLPTKQTPLELKSVGIGAITEDSKSEKSSVTIGTAMSASTQGAALQSKINFHKTKGRSPEAFVSLQLEKSPFRDLMLNEYLSKKASMGTVLRNPEEVEKLKRRLVRDFCHRCWERISQYSLRAQIIAYYNSILGLLQDFTNIRDTYFMLGEANEKKNEKTDSLAGLETDPRELKKRPRRVLTKDGKHVLNIWFIPHHSETLIIYKHMDDEECGHALRLHLRVVAALHDIIQYLCAHSKLGSSHARLGSKKMDFVSADWGGTEGIGADLREIQKQIDYLEGPTDPEQVATFLQMRREVMFLEFETAVRHSMRDTFLATGNSHAYKSITKNMYYALPALSNVQEPCLTAMYLNVPEPLEARDIKSGQLYPWRAFINRNGPFPLMFWQFQQIEYNMQLCLAGLKDVDRHVANGEILGVSLLMEDVLQSGYYDTSNVSADDDEDEEIDTKSKLSVTPRTSRPGTSLSTAKTESSLDISSEIVRRKKAKKNLSRTQQPIDSYKLLKSFLILWKRLEVFKYDWGQRKLGVEKIETPFLYKEFCKIYRAEKLFPILQSIARRYGQGDLYDGMVSDIQPLVTPTGASEIEIRVRQLLKLCESVEENMLNELRKKLAKEINLVLTERSREEGTLPTDLWKRPAMKESFTTHKPQVAEAFAKTLFSDFKESGNEFVFSKDHFNHAMIKLEGEILARERSNFESYSMYYENLLRQHHQLLYTKEQEIKHLEEELKTTKESIQTEVQCQMADQGHDLIMEITALRAKSRELRQTIMEQERDIREKIREEYNDLVQNLFASCFDLKTKFDEFREDLYDDVFEKIGEARNEAVIAITDLRGHGGGGDAREQSAKDKDDSMHRILAKNQQIRDIQRENHSLKVLMLKMKAMNNWRQTHTRGVYDKQLSSEKQHADLSKKDCIQIQLMAEEDVVLLRQHLVQLRKAFSEVSKECTEAKTELQKEMKAKEEKAHAAIQKARSQKQLEAARQANIEKLVEELDTKDKTLNRIAEEFDKTTKMHEMTSDKVKKDAVIYKKQLTHERNLKLDAFQRVDELQTQIYDIESGMFSRPQTSIGLVPSTASMRSKSVIGSSSKRNGAVSRSMASVSSSGLWPPPVIWPQNRSLTPEAFRQEKPNNLKIQRPKTVVGRLRSKIAEQLLNELDPADTHETIVRLEQMQNTVTP